MKRFFLFTLLCASAFGQSVQQSLNRLGNTGNWVLAFQWTAGSTGSVPATNADFRGAGGDCCQGFFIVQVETVPLSPSPTNGYAVAINDAAGVDALGGAAGSLSNVSPQSFASSTAAPAVQGTFSLNVNGQSVSGAKGTVFVFLQKPGTINLAKLGSGGGGSSANWFTIANPPFVDARIYNFTPQSPGGTVAIGANTVKLSPFPKGLAVGDLMYIAGTGTPETTALTAVTTTTVSFTAVGAHGAGWTIQSASGGLQQAHNVSIDGQIILIPGGGLKVWDKTVVTKAVHFMGATASYVSGSQIQPQTAGQVVFDVEGPLGAAFSHFGIIRAGLQTSGQSIYLNNDTATKIKDIYFLNGYDEVYANNSSQTEISGCYFGTFAHDGIFLNSANADATGPHIHDNDFFASGPSMNAGIQHVAPGALLVENNGFHCVSPYGLELSETGASGQVLVTGNTFDGPTTAGILVIPSVDYSGYVFTGNLFSNFSGTVGSGIWVNDTHALGGVATGNYFTGSTNVAIIGNGKGWMFNSNTVSGVLTVVQDNAGISNTYGLFTLTGTAPTNLFVGGGTSPTLLNSFPMTYTQMTAYPVANGSQIYATDGNSGCTAGASTGRTCFRENGAWTH